MLTTRRFFLGLLAGTGAASLVAPATLTSPAAPQISNIAGVGASLRTLAGDIWPEGQFLLLQGGPGSGKSSLAAHIAAEIDNVTWYTAEQPAAAVEGMFVRLGLESFIPTVWSGEPQDLATLPPPKKGQVYIIDSITTMDAVQQERFTENFVKPLAQSGGRALLLAQTYKARHSLAYTRLHEYTVGILKLVRDRLGRQWLAVTKNRWGPTGLVEATYEFDSRGRMVWTPLDPQQEAGFKYAFGDTRPHV